MRFFGLLFVVLFGCPAFAVNMQIKACQQTSSQFYVVGFQNTQDYADDQVGFCKYGNAIIGSEAMMNIVYGHTTSMAIDAFNQTKHIPATDCGTATELSGYDLDDQHSVTVCKFSDYSYIEKTTLVKGYFAFENTKLVEALKIRF